MENITFYDRKQELGLLKEEFNNLQTGKMFVIYGRRRVGKTELIRQFIKSISGNKMYFYVDLVEKQGILDSLSKTVQEQLRETRKFVDFNDFLEFIASKSDNSFVLVIDEFQRFLEVSSQFITQLQNYWDLKLKNKKILLILVGSSIGMIQKITNSKAGALYGRATKIKISPFKYSDFRLMFKELNEEEKIITYAVFGGTPYYLEKVKKIQGDIYKRIFELLLKKGAELFEEPKNLLEYENVRTHAKYNSILQATSTGKENLKEIQDLTGIDTNTLPAYIKKLDELLELLGRSDPVLGKERLGRYCLKDNFFNFWYKFIFPNQTALNLGNIKIVEENIKENFNAYIGRVFEKICKELLIAHMNKEFNDYLLDFENIGNWWNRTGEEVDIVAYNYKAKKILVGEVKWTKDLLDINVVDDLMRKAKLINFTGEYKFLFISKKGFTERALSRMKEINAIHLNLEDIEKKFEEI
ncbi:AAA family ATPase [Candidatus Woesearchaeota archaeon]|nr:AAA family ATPase [Candidatus Woesearchaeota archaeon]